MSGTNGALSNIVEKVLDSTLNFEAINCLGLSMPDALLGLGAYEIINTTYNLATEIQAELFLKNLSAVTFELQSVSSEDKMRFFNTYDDKTVKDIGNSIILLLNKIEMPLAANMIGRAHRLLMQEEITQDNFHNYCHVIKNLNQYIYNNIVDVYSDPNKKIFNGGVFLLMEGLGLTLEARQGLFPSGALNNDNPKPNNKIYMKTDFGEEFYKKIIEPYVV